MNFLPRTSVVVFCMAASLVPVAAHAQLTFNQIALTGDTAPTDDEAVFSSVFNAVINDSGDVAFRGRLRTGIRDGIVDETNDSGFFKTTNGVGSPLDVIVREGSAAPDGNGVYNDFGVGSSQFPNLAFDFNNNSQLAIHGGILNPDNNGVVFGPEAAPNSGLRIVAAEDSSLPGNVATVSSFNPADLSNSHQRRWRHSQETNTFERGAIRVRCHLAAGRSRFARRNPLTGRGRGSGNQWRFLRVCF